jgi:DNA-binding transcriptional ArsR family regulator
MMNAKTAAQCMAELGHLKRLSIFKLLVKTGPQGLPVGQIGQRLSIPGSTLSHHISRLVAVGLVKQIPESQTLYCVPVYERLSALLAFLTEECCTGIDKK